MACSNCNTPNCGCSGTYVVSQTCPPACSEVFNASCIVYTGVDITCPNDVTGITSTVVSRNDYLDTALTKIIQYFCGRFNSLVIPTTVVESDDPGIIVTPNVSGSVTTYLLSLDPAELPSASQVTGGDNVVVDGTGTAGDPYVVNANESIVAVDPASALTLLVDPSTPGPYETTYTIGIDTDLLPAIDLSSLWGFISITPIPNTPNTGDITFQLDVDQVTVETSDDKLAVALTSPGGAPANFLRTFDVTVDDAAMASFVMDTLNQTGGPGSIGLQEGTGIQLQYQSGTNTMIISSTFVDPVKWLTIQDFAGASLDAASTTSTIVLSADATSGLSAVLGGDGNIATFTLENTDKGSDQLTFLNVDCSNISGNPGGTASAAINEDTLELVGGSDIDLTVIGNQIQIDNLIDRVYAEIQSDAGDTLQAPNTTSTFTIAGGTGIGTIGDLGTQTITINNEALVYSEITGDSGVPTTAGGLSDSLAIVGGTGCSTAISADTVTIENTGVTSAVAGDGIAVSAATGAVTINSTDSITVGFDISTDGSGNFPAGPLNVDVTSLGIASQYQTVQLIDSVTGTIQDPVTSYRIAGMGINAPTDNGKFTIVAAALTPNTDYVVIVTGNRV